MENIKLFNDSFQNYKCYPIPEAYDVDNKILKCVRKELFV